MPSPIPEAVLQSRAFQVLERSFKNERLAHAILLHGENLPALEQLCMAISGQLLKTENPLEHPDCFACRPRLKTRIISIGRDDERRDGKWPEGTIRRLVTDVAMSSNQGGKKVGILFEADRLNHQASNAFLKTLEEPPAGTTLFLLTTRPYDLLDTIRSRCLNFRVPTALETIDHPDWATWAKDYRQWLNYLISGPSRQTVPHIMMGAYGLNARFQSILAEITSETWKAQKEALTDHVTSEEKDAMQAGLSKGFRKQLLSEVEKMTSTYARDLEKTNPGRLPATALNRATESLEHSAGLLEINFNQAAALERFFLTSLRIWSTAR